MQWNANTKLKDKTKLGKYLQCLKIDCDMLYKLKEKENRQNMWLGNS